MQGCKTWRVKQGGAPGEKRSLKYNGWNVGGRSKGGQRAPHEQHGRNVDKIVCIEVLSDGKV